MKIKVKLVNCMHKIHYGTDHYVGTHYIGIVKKNESAKDVADRIKKDCDYGSYDDEESFNATLQELILDTDDFEAIEL